MGTYAPYLQRDWWPINLYNIYKFYSRLAAAYNNNNYDLPATCCGPMAHCCGDGDGYPARSRTFKNTRRGVCCLSRARGGRQMRSVVPHEPVNDQRLSFSEYAIRARSRQILCTVIGMPLTQVYLVNEKKNQTHYYTLVGIGRYV